MCKIEQQIEMFKNRLQKRYKHLSKWAKREGVFAYRLYDRDIPEIPVALDIYFAKEDITQYEFNPYLVIYLYKRPYEKSEAEEAEWLSAVSNAAASLFSIPENRIFVKLRKKQKGNNSQYQRLNYVNHRIIVKEGSALFFLNLENYLDTGLFLDHRTTRLRIFKEAAGKKVLNLFSYTGSFSIHAMLGGAVQTVSVDLSNTYIKWMEQNLILNNLYNNKNYKIIKSDVIKFLENTKNKNEKWDIIICDPPTFSNSKSADMFDVNRDWEKLCLNCLLLLEDNGVLLFSYNSLKLKFDMEKLQIAFAKINNKNLKVKNITEQSIPEDFKRKKSHFLWEISIVK